MEGYDPERAPSVAEWLGLEEEQRLESVMAYHPNNGIDLPSTRLHAAIHVVVESQLALGEPVVGQAIARLRREGLRRHEAIHAVGSVVAEQLHDILRDDSLPAGTEAHTPYLERVRALTAAGWRASR